MPINSGSSAHNGGAFPPDDFKRSSSLAVKSSSSESWLPLDSVSLNTIAFSFPFLLSCRVLTFCAEKGRDTHARVVVILLAGADVVQREISNSLQLLSKSVKMIVGVAYYVASTTDPEFANGRESSGAPGGSL
jgi:hypothetical protein